MHEQPYLFLGAPGMVNVKARPGDEGLQQQLETIIHMNPPEHRKYRAVASPYFTPRALGSLGALVTESAKSLSEEPCGARGRSKPGLRRGLLSAFGREQ